MSDFDQFGLSAPLRQALDDAGYESPTPIQTATIPALLGGRDVVGIAQTGTGKTAAFALPILDGVDPANRVPQALVLAPTRELALQVCEAFERYASHLDDVHVLPVYGGQGYAFQLSALKRGVHVVVGTPGRVIDHLDRGTLDLSSVRYLVLDEADEMLNMGFAEDVEAILSRTPDEKQVALFSATMPKPIRRLAEQYLDDPVEVAIRHTPETAPNIRQRYLTVGFAQKVEALTRILEVEDFDGVIVFVRTKNASEEVAEKLRARGLSAMAINGDMVQPQRERTIEQFRGGQLDILVATDVAARGLDVERVSHVVNFDIPTDTQAYVHRIGRTGRAGRSGQAISFVTPRERRLLGAIEKATGGSMESMQLPSVADINATRLSRFDDAITTALGSDRLDFFRDVVEHYVEEFDVPEVDVAAALAIVLQGDEPLLLDAGQELRAEPPTVRERPSGPSGFVTYRIAVGRHHKVDARHILGALTNGAGLDRSQVGRIGLHRFFSLVELPGDLPADLWEALGEARVSGRLLSPEIDNGPREPRPDKPGRYSGGGKAPWRPRERGHGGPGDHRPRKQRKGR